MIACIFPLLPLLVQSGIHDCDVLACSLMPIITVPHERDEPMMIAHLCPPPPCFGTS